MPSMCDPKLFFVMLMMVWRTSASYKCPESCKCHSNDIFCVGKGLLPMPAGIPWNKTVVYVRSYKMKGEILKAEDIESNNVTKSLTLQSLGIDDIEDGSFEYFENVEFLNLNDNNLVQLREGIFRGLERIKVLHICKNQLVEINTFSFRKTPLLLDLNLSYNRISNLTWVSQLGSRHTSLVTIARLLSRLHVTLSNNPLRNSNFTTEGFSRRGMRLTLLDVGFQRIPFISIPVSYLDLSYNNITAIGPNDMLKLSYDARQLSTLLLNNNNLATIAPISLQKLSRLTALHLSNNLLETFPQYLPSLLYSLHLNSNRIKKVERFELLEGRHLTHLSLRDNKISQIFSCSFCGLMRLQFLYLDRNYISTLPEEGFMGLDLLQMLTLSRNGIHRMESGCFAGLRNIIVLDLSFITNEIDIDGDVFDHLGFLEELIIKNSPHLANFLLSSSRSLAVLKNIRRLDISHNKIINLSIDVSTFFPRLTSLDISANRWKCNRDAELIIKLVKARRHVFTHSDIICS